MLGKKVPSEKVRVDSELQPSRRPWVQYKTSTTQDDDIGPIAAIERAKHSSAKRGSSCLIKSTCSQVRALILTFKTTGSQVRELTEVGSASLIQAARAYLKASAARVQKKLKWSIPGSIKPERLISQRLKQLVPW